MDNYSGSYYRRNDACKGICKQIILGFTSFFLVLFSNFYIAALAAPSFEDIENTYLGGVSDGREWAQDYLFVIAGAMMIVAMIKHFLRTLRD